MSKEFTVDEKNKMEKEFMEELLSFEKDLSSSNETKTITDTIYKISQILEEVYKKYEN